MKRKLRIICAITALLTTIILLAGRPVYEKDELNYTPAGESDIEKASCSEYEPAYITSKVSYYNQEYCKEYNPECRTASGEIFDENAFTCACSYDYSLYTILKISYKENSIVVRCNDRGDFKKYGRVADLSEEAFKQLAPKKKGEIEAKIEVVYPEYDQLNQYRENLGLPKLTRNEELEISARASAKAIQIGERSWSHDGWTASVSAYYDYVYAGENLARDFGTFDKVLSAWHDSEKHRDNLQSERFCEVGIGHYGDVWVLHLGKR